ncbi:PspC domain-containing protein [Microbacterium sp. LjRoot45]|uniref:PspC domain-containing protein n=1 Tax=Microbacterium sp. LjRoot45 TaxID=3342329 RepID=UPI003ECC37D3
MTTAPPIDPGPPPAAPTMTSRSDGIFSWTAGLGLVRGEGWIGGVAAGVAARLRIDPLIVRGILLVIGLFGFPVLFLYGVAWALLPDLDGRIPLQEAVRGRFTASQVGAGLFVLAGFVPFPVLMWGGSFGLVSVAWVFALGFVLFVGVLLAGGLILLIVRAARRTPGESELRTASAASDTPGPSADESGREPDDVADPRGVDALAAGDAASLPAPLDDGDVAAAEAPPADLAAWREQHAAWKEQDQQWRQQQQDAVRAAREEARRERQARATAFAAEAAERRRLRRASHPRTPAAAVVVALGLAVVVGTVAALTEGGPLAPAQGLFVAALVLAAGMVIAGALRRRSGFLAFVTLLTLFGGAAATAVPAAQALHLGNYGISNTSDQRYPASAPFTQPWGDLSVFLGATGDDGTTYIDKRSGATFITLEPGVEVTLEATTSTAALYYGGSDNTSEDLTRAAGTTMETLPDGRVRYRAVVAAGTEPVTTRETIVIEQDSGYIELYMIDTRIGEDQ